MTCDSCGTTLQVGVRLSFILFLPVIGQDRPDLPACVPVNSLNVAEYGAPYCPRCGREASFVNTPKEAP